MNKLIHQVAWLFFLAPLIYLAAVWKRIPASIPMKFNWNGDVSRWGTKTEMLTTLLILTAVNIGTYILLTNVHRIDPKKYGEENKQRMKNLAIAISLFIAVITCLLIYTAVTGQLNFTLEFIFTGVGVLFSVIGNYMYNMKPNYFAGFRLPWTLENEENWKRTHLLGGKLWFAGGIAIVIATLILPRVPALIAFGIILFIMLIIPIVYSYRLFKKQNTGGSH